MSRKGKRQKKEPKKNDTKRVRKIQIEDFVEYRKIIYGAGRACQVTLPKHWAHEMDLDKVGAGVNVICFKQDRNFLSLTPAKSRRERTPATILGTWHPSRDVDERECLRVKRKILATYLVGYEKVFVKNRSGKIPKNLRYDVENFCKRKLRFGRIRSVGSEGLEINVPGIMVPKTFLKDRIEDMRDATILIHERALLLMDNFDMLSAKAVLNMDDHVDMICHEIVRFCKLAAQNPFIITEMKLRNYRDLIGFRVISRRVERCADHAVRMVSDMVELYEKEDMVKIDTKTKKEVEDYSRKVINIFNRAIAALFAPEKNYIIADNVIEKVDSIVSKLERRSRALKSTTPEQLWCQRRLFDSLKRTAEYTKTIAEVTCNMHIHSVL